MRSCDAYPRFGSNRDAVALLRRQVHQCHSELHRGVAAWMSNTRSLGALPSPVRLYVHALCVEDVTVQSLLRKQAPLFTSLWADRVGPADLGEVGEYSTAVHASTNSYLVELSSSGLTPLVDLERLGLGRRTVSWILRRFVLTELARIGREIAGFGAPPAAPRGYQMPTDAGDRSRRTVTRRAAHNGLHR